MATDFSQVPQDQMDHIMGLLDNNPDFIPNVDERRAFTAEYFRRKSGSPAKPASNVEANLEAAAAPIALEPVAGPSKRDAYAARMEAAGYTPKEAGMAADYEGRQQGAYELQESDETLRRGAAYQRDQDRRMGQFDATLADAMGHNAGPGMATEIMPNAGSRPAWAENAFGGEMINVDGVMVQAYDLGDGKLRYTLGDVKRAKEAAIDAQRSAELSKNAQEDLANYGTRQLYRTTDQIDPKTGFPMVEPMPSTGPAPGMDLSDEEQAQQRRLGERRAAEARTRESHAYKRAQAIRMGESAGMLPSEAMALLSQPGGQAKLAMMGADAAAKRRMAARERLRAVTALAGGSQNLNPVMRAQINTLLKAQEMESTNPDAARSLRYTLPGGRLAAEVDRANAEAAMDIVKRQNIGALFNRDAEAARGMQAEAWLRKGRTLAGTAADDAGGMFGGDPRTAADRALIRAGYSSEERRMILDEMFGPPAGQPPAAGPAPAAPLTPLPLPEDHNHPVRVPDGTYPMM